MTAQRPLVKLHPAYLRSLALLTLAYWVTAVAGLQWAVAPGAGTAVWPAAGIALVSLLLGGVRLWPAIVIGRLLTAVTVNSPQPMVADVAIALGTAAGAVIPVLLVKRMTKFEVQLSNLRSVAWLVVVGAGLGGLISAAVGANTLWLTGTPLPQVTRAALVWFFGFAVGVLTVAPLVLSWMNRAAWKLSRLGWLHFVLAQAIFALAAVIVLFDLTNFEFRAWHLFPLMIWPALAFNVRGASVSILTTSLVGLYSAVHGIGPIAEISPITALRMLYGQEFVAMSAVTILILAAVADERRGAPKLAASEQALREEKRALELLNASGARLAAELDLDCVVQHVTDVGVQLTGAQFGAFFYNRIDNSGEAYLLYALSGAKRDQFDGFGHPRNTEVFGPTFAGERVVRSEDITKDARYGKMAPHHGMPKGHLPVRAYLAAPVMARDGEVIGGLFFGHADAGVFSERAERSIVGLAAQAAIAFENARLFNAAQREIADRKRAEAHQSLLINELNHRVKNTLATVQSLATQITRGHSSPKAARDHFIGRLIALSRAHDVLTAKSWGGADLGEIVKGAISPFESEAQSRFHVEGPSVWLNPRAALSIAMALHELGTNAVKYGALSNAAGHVDLSWKLDATDAERLHLTWCEHGGPQVVQPTRQGFGSRLIQQGLAAELNGTAVMHFRPEGLCCEINARLDSGQSVYSHPGTELEVAE